jgi:hypothetical protein
MSAHAAYHTLMARRSIILPVSGLAVRLAPPTVRIFVDAGLSLRSKLPAGDIDPGLADEVIRQARLNAQRLVCAAAEDPQFRTHPGPGQFDVALLVDEDLMAMYTALVDWGTSIFYGTHRAELDPQKDYLWIDKQTEALGLVDIIARRYGKLPHEVEALTFVEFARALAAAESGGGLDKEAIAAIRNGGAG